MVSEPGAGLGAADLDTLARHARALADGLDAALPRWVEREVARVADAWRPGLASSLSAEAAAAAEQVRRDVVPQVRALLDCDVDAQSTNPLAIVRAAVRYPTAVLHEAGVPGVVRDEFAERTFPDDDYDLAPAAFADIDPALHELGLMWGAAKAHVVLARRRAEGRR
ncbi:MAG: hypothetical protein JWN46_3691 [Acidimicrobiales bacterium]|nr:hypothetical protein [Acidimicrobiales bacterium]